MSDPETVSFGYEEVSPAEKTARVGAVFSSVAGKYDVMNDAMSAGMHRLWKDRFVRRVTPRAGEAILEMAGGTGDIAFRMAAAMAARAGGGAHDSTGSGEATGTGITVADINQDMLDVGIERAIGRGLSGLVWSRQNAEALSFPDRFFDAYTIAFGIRNVTRIDLALAEAQRVLRFGGRFFCLEFSTTEWPGFAEAYDAYSHKLVPRLGQMIAGDAESYRYLIESIRRFPPMPAFAGMIAAAGFSQVKVEPILGGLVAIHSGWKV
jgi:demethylmenaquinone methyltransferase/2-methoxy-6-polyprenyl-1,4-benzoquinol methylase